VKRAIAVLVVLVGGVLPAYALAAAPNYLANPNTKAARRYVAPAGHCRGDSSTRSAVAAHAFACLINFARKRAHRAPVRFTASFNAQARSEWKCAQAKVVTGACESNVFTGSHRECPAGHGGCSWYVYEGVGPFTPPPPGVPAVKDSATPRAAFTEIVDHEPKGLRQLLSAHWTTAGLAEFTRLSHAPPQPSHRAMTYVVFLGQH